MPTLLGTYSRQSAEQSTTTADHTGPSGSSMEEPAMVPHSTGHAGGLPNPHPISDPILGPISKVVNFLTHLFKEGYQYRSLNAYRSAVSSAHEKAEVYEVGQHPFVSRLLKRAFNQRPRPRYEF